MCHSDLCILLVVCGCVCIGIYIIYPVKDDQLEYSEKSWRPEKTCCHSDSHEKLSANAGVKNSPKSKINVSAPKYVCRYTLNISNI